MAGGKSYLLRWAALYCVIWLSKQTGIRNIPVGLFSEDYPTLKDRQISRIVREFPSWIGELKESKEEGFAFFVRDEYGGGRILLRNLDDPAKYMSSEFAGQFLEEATRNPEQTFADLRNRLRYPGVTDVKFMAATNPGGLGHSWCKKFFVDKDSGDPENNRFFYVHANAYDNKFISSDYIHQLEALPEEKRKMYLDGSWDFLSGAVFSTFRRDKHVIKSITPKAGLQTLLSFDWGYHAPFSCHAHSLIEMKTRDGVAFKRLITWREWYGTEKNPSTWAELIFNSLKKDGLTAISGAYGDPAMTYKMQDGGQAVSDQMQQAWQTLNGKYWITIQRALNKRIPRVALTQDWLADAPDGLPFWLITEDNPNLIRTLPILVYDESKHEDVDTNLEDHAWDDCSYGMSMLQYHPGRPGQAKRSPSFLANTAIVANDDGTSTNFVDPSLFGSKNDNKDFRAV